MWRDLVIGLATAVIVTWLVLIRFAHRATQGKLLREALRILPDLVRLLTRLATDSTLPAPPWRPSAHRTADGLPGPAH
jgi:hypothetical protein